MLLLSEGDTRRLRTGRDPGPTQLTTASVLPGADRALRDRRQPREQRQIRSRLPAGSPGRLVQGSVSCTNSPVQKIPPHRRGNSHTCPDLHEEMLQARLERQKGRKGSPGRVSTKMWTCFRAPETQNQGSLWKSAAILRQYAATSCRLIVVSSVRINSSKQTLCSPAMPSACHVGPEPFDLPASPSERLPSWPRAANQAGCGRSLIPPALKSLAGRGSGPTVFPRLVVVRASEISGSHSTSETTGSASQQESEASLPSQWPSSPRSATSLGSPISEKASKNFRSHVTAAASGVEITLEGRNQTTNPPLLATDASDPLPERRRPSQYKPTRNVLRLLRHPCRPMSLDQTCRLLAGLTQGKGLQADTAPQSIISSAQPIARNPPGSSFQVPARPPWHPNALHGGGERLESGCPSGGHGHEELTMSPPRSIASQAEHWVEGSDEPTSSCSRNVYARSLTATHGELVFLSGR